MKLIMRFFPTVSTLTLTIILFVLIHNVTSHHKFPAYIHSHLMRDLFLTILLVMLLLPLTYLYVYHRNKINTQLLVANQELERSEQLYRTLLDTMSDAVIIHVQEKIVFANQGAFHMVGAAVEQELIGRSIHHFISPSSHEDLRNRVSQVYDKQSKAPLYEMQCMMLDGTPLQVESSTKPILWMGKPAGISVVRDVTNRNLERKKYDHIESLLNHIIDNMHVGVWSVDGQSNETLLVSKAIEEIYGIPADDFLSNRDYWRTIVHPDDLAKVEANQIKLSEGQPLEHTYRIIDGSSNQIKYIQDKVMPIVNSRGELLRLDGFVVDVTEKMEAMHKLEYIAYHDELTGLLNRHSMKLKLNELVEQSAGASQIKFAVVNLDMDNFKKINDTLGQYCGDQLLQQIAQRLAHFIHSNEWAARQNGDEFTIILSNFVHREEIHLRVEQLMSCLQLPYTIEGYDFYLTASLGVSIYPDDAIYETKLMTHADSALAYAKKFRNQYNFFEDSMDLSLESIVMEGALRSALEQNQFELHYQPQYDVRTQHMIGAEALIRWNHPVMGQVPPVKFIALAEETGLIENIGEWVIREVCTNLKKWQNLGHSVVPVAVNLSARQFRSKHFISNVRKIIQETGVQPHLLEFEITESMAMNAELALAVLNEFKEIGIPISVDDFGTGYSSFAYLKLFPLNRLKIDKSFINNMDTIEGASIVSAITTLAHHLSLQVVAEGVETEHQFQLLQAIHCDFVQGYYFNKPLVREAFESLLSRSV
jgi:diguanylate cyclase (GGDEF)-like protein/PAS domain S-box-containing protein